VDQTVAASGAPGSLADPGAPGSGPAGASGPSSRLNPLGIVRWLRRIAGVVPFGAYVTLGLLLPMVAVAVGAFQNSNGGGFTFSNISAATHGIYLKGFWQSIELSVITALLPGFFGLLIAYAIFTAKRGAILRQVAITASGVFANFGGVPLAFLFIATLGSSGLATQWLSNIGFNPYNHRHRAGTNELGYATGEASIQNCTTNGTIEATSRYKAFSAEVHNPTPSAVSTAKIINTGKSTTVAGGWIPKLKVKRIITTNPIAKSTTPEQTADKGKINRGKYTLVMTCWFATTMFVQLLSACAK